MDATPNSLFPATTAPHPARGRRVGLVLQGGGALGAYQAGVFQALDEAGFCPDWLAGVSIGAINAALIAGNPPERRLERLHAFWNRVTARPVYPAFYKPFWGVLGDGDAWRKAHTLAGSLSALLLGTPGFFTPRVPNVWLLPRGAQGATGLYDSAPLRATLEELVDFDRLNGGEIRFAVGAVNVATGNFTYFDSHTTRIGVEHVMASGALPPALPPVEIGGDLYWDGGIVSNTPLQHLLDNIGADDAVVFQVDLFSARGAVPRDLLDVLGRDKDIRYSSRTRMVTDTYTAGYKQALLVRDLLSRVPEDRLTDADRALRAKLSDLPALSIIQLVYQQAAWEGQAKDYDFSRESMSAHWSSGLRDTRNTLAHRDWLELPPEDVGIVTHDIHRPAP